MEVDTLPKKALLICPAGKYFHDKNTVADCLKFYSINEVVDTLKHEKNIYYEKDKNFKKWTKKCIPKTKRELPEIFCSHVDTRFQTAMKDLRNTCYASYWDAQLGTKSYNPLPFPLNVPMDTITFGKKTPGGITAKDCINYYWQLENETLHAKMLQKRKIPVMPKKITNKPCKRFAYDRRGIWVKGCMKWANENLTVADCIQADFQENNGCKLGEHRKIPKPL